MAADLSDHDIARAISELADAYENQAARIDTAAPP
jgi:hypothetical protein